MDLLETVEAEEREAPRAFTWRARAALRWAHLEREAKERADALAAEARERFAVATRLGEATKVLREAR